MRIVMVSVGLFGLVLAVPVYAQVGEAPAVKVHDVWVYRDTVENKTGWHQTRTEMTVERAGESGFLLAVREEGSTMPPKEQMVGSDWSRSRSVNGQQQVVNRPLDFPLSTGKSWTIDYSEDHPNRQHDREHIHQTYTVTGWEEITVPGGTFRALKIEADGQWTADLAPAINANSTARIDAQGATQVLQTNKTLPTTAAGRTYKAFWYVPETKRWVKAVEEYFSANGVLSERLTEELESFKPAG